MKIPKSGPFGLYTIAFFLLLLVLYLAIRVTGITDLRMLVLFTIYIIMWFVGLMEGKSIYGEETSMFFSIFKRKPRHDHNWKALASCNEIITDQHWTHILFQCDCGEWYVDTVRGAWTPEDVGKLK
jgi:hypothetical protein